MINTFLVLKLFCLSLCKEVQFSPCILTDFGNHEGTLSTFWIELNKSLGNRWLVSLNCLLKCKIQVGQKDNMDLSLSPIYITQIRLEYCKILNKRKNFSLKMELEFYFQTLHQFNVWKDLESKMRRLS